MNRVPDDAAEADDEADDIHDIMPPLTSPTEGDSPVPYPSPRLRIPLRIKVASIVVAQFLNFKQTGVTHFASTRAEIAMRREEDEEWKQKNITELPLPEIKLSAGEESLYAAALKKLENWINEEEPAVAEPVAELPIAEE